MNDDVDDRLIDHALREFHRAQDHVDLSERVAEAWSRGERGADLTDIVSWDAARVPTPPVPLPMYAERSRDWKYVAAAAVLMVALAMLAWMRWRPTTARRSPIAPIAAADQPLRVFRDGSVAAIESAELRRGDVLVLGAVQAVGVTFASEDRMVLGPCTVLTWVSAADLEGEGLALERGRVEVATVDRAVALEFGFARAVIERQSRVAAELVFEDSALACAPIADSGALREIIAGARDHSRLVRVSVASGTLELARDGARERITAGGEREVWSTLDRVVSAEETKALLVQLNDVIGGLKLEPYGMQRAWQEREMAAELAKWLSKRPQYWPVLRENARARAASYKLEGDAGHRLVDFLLLAGTPRAIELSRELWLASPTAFREHQIVALAGRGVPELELELRAMVDHYDPAAGPSPVLAAAALAIRGDGAAADLLSSFLADAAPPTKPEDVDRVALAAYTLDSRGDAQAWLRAMDAIAPYIEGLSRRGAQLAAGNMTLSLRFLHEARRDRRLLSPSDYLEELPEYLLAHETEIATDGDVRAALDRLRH